MLCINTDMFIYTAKSFVAEISKLGGRLEPFFVHIAGTNKQGFELESQRTGKVVQMVFDHPIENSKENRVIGWTFKPLDNNAFLSLVIFNG